MVQAITDTADNGATAATEETEDYVVDRSGRLTRLSRFLAARLGIVPAFQWKKFIRLAGVMTLDFAAIAGALFLLLPLLQERVETRSELISLPLFVIGACGVAVALLFLSGLYRRNWRFTSLSDCFVLGLNIAIVLGALWGAIWFMTETFDQSQFTLLAILHFCLSFLIMQVMRLSRRAAVRLPFFSLSRDTTPVDLANREKVVLVGRADWVESVIRITRSDRNTSIGVVGVLLPEADGPISQVRGVPVLGFPENLLSAVLALEERDRRPDTIILCDDAVNLSPRDIASITRRTRDLGIKIVRVGDDWGHLLGRPARSGLDKLSTTELLGRREFELREAAISQQVAGETILVTGAGGTIGGELARQLANFKPGKLVLLDHSEFNLYTIERQIREAHPELPLGIALCDVRNFDEIRRVFERQQPAIVYHAAAIKHVPIAEANPCAAAFTNVIGTKNVADAVCEFGARAMVQVSTDKAVNPVGIMGASKRVGELYAQSLDLCGVDDPDAPRFMTTRFGNVLGSSGSVVPLFKSQLLAGGPLTVTHPEIKRFFMTVRESVQLILESSSRALQDGTPRGRIMVLDMGEPVKIVDLAKRMIRLHGFEPDVDMEIKFTGLRPGEKLYEELFDSCEVQEPSSIPGIFEAQSHPIPLPLITRAIEEIGIEIEKGNDGDVRRITHHLTSLPSTSPTLAGFVANSKNIWGRKFRTVEEV
ncbi:MAG: polysaccharide biosynthesis protein [Erythrobacter sp.]|uniref:polysaccharide biosynthesis protein n=1 Tax=Erythrobacter sp. TaxID=1042 RepID=UPI00261F8235|nr:polysaccharide biosynthesis protein [Erythrobacter sp.]MDJ0978692.1 polysaccharide biosynthesis protein [Erythrobacter sp.]